MKINHSQYHMRISRKTPLILNLTSSWFAHSFFLPKPAFLPACLFSISYAVQGPGSGYRTEDRRALLSTFPTMDVCLSARGRFAP